MDATSKSIGVTKTERMLADFCERSFLKLWIYPNPYKDDGKELCDVLAVFGGHVFVFFDREKAFTDTPESDPLIAWDRWKRRAIDRQVITARGAERYIRSGRGIFPGAKRTLQFPLAILALSSRISTSDPKRMFQLPWTRGRNRAPEH